MSLNSQNIISHQIAAKNLKPLKNIKNIIAIASGKGGVGKSTTAVNLGIALHKLGARVGILDADIYGPSLPIMLGVNSKPESKDDKSLEPMVAHGVQSMSIGYLIGNDDTAMIWRGPMVSSALTQLLQDTNWDNLDYLLIDLPPGTGDIQLTMAQKIPVTAGIIVTTPQDIALSDAKKAYKMFEKLNIPVLGVIENMSYHVCSKCGHEDSLFGKGGAEKLNRAYGIELLGKIPLEKIIREGLDNGTPITATDENCELSQDYQAIAQIAAAKLSLLPKAKVNILDSVSTD